MPSRRALLRTGVAAAIAGTAGVAGLEAGLLPGRARVHDALGLTGEDGVVPDVPAGPTVSGSFTSTARRTQVAWTAVYPHGQSTSAQLPIVLKLHGRGGDHTSAVGDLGADRYLTAVVREGVPPFVLVAVDGGRDSYWHPRSSGEDPPGMLTTELLPLLAKQGLRTDRYGVLGWSMGGYGAMLLAANQGPEKVFAAGALSPAVWRDFEDTAAGAYDGPADFDRYQLFVQAERLRKILVRIDCGRDDPFADGVRALLQELPEASGGLQAGAHTAGYWRRMLPDQLKFLGGATPR